MQPNSSIIGKLARGLISGLAVCAAVCFCIERGIAQIPVETTSPSKTLTTEELNKLPNQPRDFSKLSLPGNVAPREPKVLPDATHGFVTSIKTPPGLHTISFSTAGKDTVEVYFPNRISNGGSFTATMKLIPGNGESGGKLDDYSLMIEGQRFPLTNGVFEVRLPGQSMESTRVLLINKQGKQVSGVELPVFAKIVPPTISSLPTSGFSGDLIVITCPCQGALGPSDYIMLGGQAMKILASASGSLVALNTYHTPGPTEIETNVGGIVTKSDFRNLTLKLSADKLNLVKGEQTTVHIVVGGLEKLKAPAIMTVEATGVVTMGGGNSQKITIDPSSVAADGTYTTAEVLVANSAGTFGVKVTVTVDEQKK
jgi:hypothetical protein